MFNFINYKILLKKLQYLWYKLMLRWKNFFNFDFFRFLCFLLLSLGLRYNYITLCGCLLILSIILLLIYFCVFDNTELSLWFRAYINDIRFMPIRYIRKCILYIYCIRVFLSYLFFYTTIGYFIWQLCIYFFLFTWKFLLINLITYPIILVIGLFAIFIFINKITS